MHIDVSKKNQDENKNKIFKINSLQGKILNSYRLVRSSCYYKSRSKTGNGSRGMQPLSYSTDQQARNQRIRRGKRERRQFCPKKKSFLNIKKILMSNNFHPCSQEKSKRQNNFVEISIRVTYQRRRIALEDQTIICPSCIRKIFKNKVKKIEKNIYYFNEILAPSDDHFTDYPGYGVV